MKSTQELQQAGQLAASAAMDVAGQGFAADAVVEQPLARARAFAEPLIAHSGGPDGLFLVRKILADAADHLEPEGRLLVEVGYGQAKLSTDRQDLPFLWLETEDSQGDMFLLTREDLLAAAPSAGSKSTPKRRK